MFIANPDVPESSGVVDPLVVDFTPRNIAFLGFSIISEIFLQSDLYKRNFWGLYVFRLRGV